MATTAATELAALPPIPPDRGRPFHTSSSTPTPSNPAASITATAATPTTFWSGSVGRRPPSPWIAAIATPGAERRRASTTSPGRSRARPKTSKPHMTFPTGGRRVGPGPGRVAHDDSARARRTSANTPAAVTSGPAPGPRTTSGVSA